MDPAVPTQLTQSKATNEALLKARLALMDYKGKFMASFAKAEALLWRYSTEVTQRVILSDFCETMMHQLAGLNDKFQLDAFSAQTKAQPSDEC